MELAMELAKWDNLFYHTRNNPREGGNGSSHGEEAGFPARGWVALPNRHIL